MGNRAVITTTKNFINNGKGIYLHWNGGRDSVEAFLGYCKLKGYKSLEEDDSSFEKLAKIAGNFIGDMNCIEIADINRLDCDNYDNGTYIVRDWKIIDRKYKRNPEQKQYDFYEMLNAINLAQPIDEQLPDNVIEGRNL